MDPELPPSSPRSDNLDDENQDLEKIIHDTSQEIIFEDTGDLKPAVETNEQFVQTEPSGDDLE